MPARGANSNPGGVRGLLDLLKEAGTDREDCRRFGAVKRFCHNEKCANYSILQLVRPNVRHVCKYLGRGCSRPLLRQAPSSQWQRLVENEAREQLHADGLMSAAPAWRRSEPLPAPSAFTPYASGNKAVVDAGEQALLQSSFSFVADSPDHPHREYYDGTHEAIKTSRSQSSLGSARSSSAGSARHEEWNISPAIRGAGGTASRPPIDRRNCASASVENSSSIRPRSAAPIVETCQLERSQPGRPNSAVSSFGSKPLARPQSAMANIESRQKGGVLRGGRPVRARLQDWTGGVQDLDSFVTDLEQYERHEVPVSAWSPDTTYSPGQSAAQGAAAWNQAGNERTSTFDSFLSRSGAKQIEVRAGCIVPKKIGLGPEMADHDLSASRSHSASKPKLRGIVEEKSNVEEDEARMKQERLKDVVTPTRALKSREFSAEKLKTATGESETPAITKESEKQRWGRPASAVRRMDVINTISRFERDPAMLPRPSTASARLRPGSAMRLSPTVRPKSADIAATADMTAESDEGQQMLSTNAAAEKVSSRKGRRPATAQGGRRESSKSNYHMSLCSLSTPVGLERPLTAPSRQVSVTGLAGGGVMALKTSLLPVKPQGQISRTASNSDRPRELAVAPLQSQPSLEAGGVSWRLSAPPREEQLTDNKSSTENAQVLAKPGPGRHEQVRLAENLNIKLSRDQIKYELDASTLPTSSAAEAREQGCSKNLPTGLQTQKAVQEHLVKSAIHLRDQLHSMVGMQGNENAPLDAIMKSTSRQSSFKSEGSWDILQLDADTPLVLSPHSPKKLRGLKNVREDEEAEEISSSVAEDGEPGMQNSQAGDNVNHINAQMIRTEAENAGDAGGLSTVDSIDGIENTCAATRGDDGRAFEEVVALQGHYSLTRAGAQTIEITQSDAIDDRDAAQAERPDESGECALSTEPVRDKFVKIEKVASLASYREEEEEDRLNQITPASSVLSELEPVSPEHEEPFQQSREASAFDKLDSELVGDIDEIQRRIMSQRDLQDHALLVDLEEQNMNETVSHDTDWRFPAQGLKMSSSIHVRSLSENAADSPRMDDMSVRGERNVGEPGLSEASWKHEDVKAATEQLARLEQLQLSGMLTATNFKFLGPDGSHPSHLVTGLHAQAKVGWETTFASEVLRLNREKFTRELMPLDYYKKVLSGNILVAHRMVKEGAKGVLKAKFSVSTKITDPYLQAKDLYSENPTLNRFYDGVYTRTLVGRKFRSWQEFVVDRNNLSVMQGRVCANRYYGLMMFFACLYALWYATAAVLRS